jgi:hypothetical protein
MAKGNCKGHLCVSFCLRVALLFMVPVVASYAAVTVTMSKSQRVTASTSQTLETITVTTDSSTEITAAADIRLMIPSGNSIWTDPSGYTFYIEGPASSKVTTSTSDTRESANQTLMIDVTSDFAAGDSVSFIGVKMTGAASAEDGFTLGADVNNNAAADGSTTTRISVGGATISSATGDMQVNVGGSTVELNAITVTDTSGSTTAANDIRIVIPTTLNMGFDTSGSMLSVSLTGATDHLAGGTAISFSGANTCIIDLSSTMDAGDSITIRGLRVSNFSAVSADCLGLELGGGGTQPDAYDDKVICIGPPTLSATNSTFTAATSAQASGSITITENGASATITGDGTDAEDLFLKLPEGWGFTYDTSDTGGVTTTGTISTSTVVAFSGSKTAVINVATNAALKDTVTAGSLTLDTSGTDTQLRLWVMNNRAQIIAVNNALAYQERGADSFLDSGGSGGACFIESTREGIASWWKDVLAFSTLLLCLGLRFRSGRST